MSILYITEHDENINDIEESRAEDTAASIKKNYAQNIFTKLTRARPVVPLNQRRDAEGIIHINNSTKYDHKTLGQAPDNLDHKAPCKFLKKGAGVRWLRESQHKCDKGPGMPPLPAYKKEKPEQKPCVNIIQRNVDSVKKSCLKKPLPKYIDTPKGARHELIDSGLVPQYICRKNFAKVPAYVKNHKKQFEEMKARCKEEEKQSVVKRLDNAEVISEETRKSRLEDLTKNLNALNGVYQQLSICTDTLAKAKRKSCIEKSLVELENNIKLLQEHPVCHLTD